MENKRPIVAVVDDDPRLLESLEELVESAGYAACCFRSAGHLLVPGLADLDLLVTDIGMPGTDGFELHDIVKKARPELPVFLVTGRHEIADQGRAQDISGFFRKPFDAPALLAAIAEALQKKREMEGDMRMEQHSRKSAPPLPQRKNDAEQPIVVIVDDDEAVREALSELILSAGFRPVSFASTQEVLDAEILHRPGCLILDVRIPEQAGFICSTIWREAAI